MPQTAHSWSSIINEVKRTYSSIDSRSFKFKQLVIALSENLTLFPRDVEFLGLHLGMKLFPRPKGIGEDWKYSLCKSFLGQRYTNPQNSLEYAVVVPPGYHGQLPYVIHRTDQGFADARWFLEVIPELVTIITNPSLGKPFSTKFNLTLNEFFETKNQGKGITWGQLQALNLFFEKYVPGIEGICSNCFKLSLPRAGAGERWTFRSDERYEVRLSAAKPQSPFPGQQREYVTHTELNPQNTTIHVMWDTNKCQPLQTNVLRQEATHIPWEVYDFNKCSIGMPACQCKKK